MKRFFGILVLLSLFVQLNAGECDSKLFSLSAYKHQGSSLRVEDILQELSLKCNLSIVFRDEKSKKAIKKQLDFVNIKDYTFEDFLEFLFDESNLFYTYDKRKSQISVQYYKSKTFSIDYINVSELESESTKSINTGTSAGIGGYNEGNLGTGSSYGVSSIGGSGNDLLSGSGSSPSTDYTLMKTKSKFAFWKNLKKNIVKLFDNPDDVKLFLNQDASLLTVTANKKELQKVEKFIDTLMNKMHKQVLIEAKIIEVVYNNSSSVGIDWSKLNLYLTGSLSGGNNIARNFSYKLTYGFTSEKFLQFLNQYGTVKVLSNPKILTLNNQPAVINVGEQLSYKYQTGSVTTTGGTAAGTNVYSLGSTFVGITLYVIPEVSANNEIVMKINPVISKLSDEISVQEITRELPPDVKIKQMTSIVKVKDGQKVLIGGLIGVLKNKESNRVPILGYLPFLEGIFGNKKDLRKKSEMFILIVPKIVKSDNMPTIDEMDFEFMNVLHPEKEQKPAQTTLKEQ